MKRYGLLCGLILRYVLNSPCHLPESLLKVFCQAMWKRLQYKKTPNSLQRKELGASWGVEDSNLRRRCQQIYSPKNSHFPALLCFITLYFALTYHKRRDSASVISCFIMLFYALPHFIMRKFCQYFVIKSTFNQKKTKRCDCWLKKSVLFFFILLSWRWIYPLQPPPV